MLLKKSTPIIKLYILRWSFIPGQYIISLLVMQVANTVVDPYQLKNSYYVITSREVFNNGANLEDNTGTTEGQIFLYCQSLTNSQ